MFKTSKRLFSLSISHVKGKTAPLSELTIPGLLRDAADRCGDKKMICFPEEGIEKSWPEMIYDVERTAAGLLELGFKKGDRLGVWLPNQYDWVRFFCAATEVGGICVNVNPAYKASELKHSLQLTGIHTLVMRPELKNNQYGKVLNDIIPELGKNKEELNFSDLPDLKRIICSSDEKDTLPGTINSKEIYSENIENLKNMRSSFNCFDAANIQFTSGTTGFPKGATLSHHNIVNNSYFVGQAQELTPEDTMILPIPLYHCFGIVMGFLCSLRIGCRQVWPSALFKAEETLKSINHYQGTCIYGVPTMYQKIMDSPDLEKSDCTHLRTGVAGGTLVPAYMMRKITDKLNITGLIIGYGMTETSPTSFSSNIHTSFDDRCNSVGTIYPNVECKIIDKNGEIVPIGKKGEICTKGYIVMKGYWNQEKKTKESIDSDGFMHTGDIGTFDENGYCRITGRIKDMIIRGGENVYPAEIEHHLETHPDIQSIAIVGVYDKMFDEAVCACVIPKEGKTITFKDIKDFCSDKISYFKIPAYLLVCTEFPMTVTGKIQKYKLADIANEKLGLVSIKQA